MKGWPPLSPAPSSPLETEDERFVRFRDTKGGLPRLPIGSDGVTTRHARHERIILVEGVSQEGM